MCSSVKKVFTILKDSSTSSTDEKMMKIMQVDFYTPLIELLASELEKVAKATNASTKPITQMPNRNCFLSMHFFAFSLVLQLRMMR